MPSIPNKLSQFWQELKRRKVVRVITVYAAAAFVILELLSIIIEPLRLPDWTLQFAIVFLCIGFIVAIILSWIYDIHPEGGLVMTGPADKVEVVDIPISSQGWKIASYISFVVIVGLIVLNIIPHSGKKEILDKSIAVLPFIDDSPDKNNEHIINGIMEDLLINLQSIKELRVPGRTTTEQYRNNPKSIAEIASEMNVAYIVEGSGQRYGNKIRLRVQLVEGATDKHIWADSYDEEIKGPEDIFRIQSQIAESIAAELEAAITPKEKELIDKVPTTSLTAYGFYQKGRDEHEKYRIDNKNKGALKSAENYYHKALDHDSTFAQAYTGLAIVYWDKYYLEEFLSEIFLDSVLILADIALSFDDQLAEAYVIRGNYYWENYKKEQALKEYDKAIKFNPNESQAYYGKGYIFFRDDDLVKALDNMHKATSLHRGPLLAKYYGELSFVYHSVFIERSIYYAEEKLKLDNDSANYFERLGTIEETDGNIEKAVEFYKKSFTIDSVRQYLIFRVAVVHNFLGLNQEYLEYFKMIEKELMAPDSPDPGRVFRLGHAYWVNGFKEDAEYYFDKGLRILNEIIELDRYRYADYIAFYRLAAAYAFLGDNDKAFGNLRRMNQRPRMPKWMVKDLNNDPLFNSIRDEPEFQQIVRDVEAKYQAEQERVREWLEENEMR
jgi:TolB-like protein